jgi:hypothetical protein
VSLYQSDSLSGGVFVAEDTDIVQASIVMLGQFNPAIISPAWLARHEIISEDEFKAAEVEVIHRQITKFAIDSVLIACEPTRFSIEMTSEPIIRLVDLVLQIFRDTLKETPVMAVGINYAEHWRLETWQQRVALGRKLAPKEPWEPWAKSWDVSDPEKVGGLNSLTVMEHYTDRNGRRQAEIGPSVELADKTRGVYLRVNHHRDTEWKEGDGAEAATTIVADEFDKAISAARDIIGSIREFAKTLEKR